MDIIKKFTDKRRKTLPTIAEWGEEVYFDNIKINNGNMDTVLNSTRSRYDYIRYCFPILSHEFMTDLSDFCKDYKNIVEVGCGSGWMSY